MKLTQKVLLAFLLLAMSTLLITSCSTSLSSINFAKENNSKLLEYFLGKYPEKKESKGKFLLAKKDFFTEFGIPSKVDSIDLPNGAKMPFPKVVTLLASSGRCNGTESIVCIPTGGGGSLGQPPAFRGVECFTTCIPGINPEKEDLEIVDPDITWPPRVTFLRNCGDEFSINLHRTYTCKPCVECNEEKPCNYSLNLEEDGFFRNRYVLKGKCKCETS